MDIGNVIEARSDRVPGRFSCIECNKIISIQESWRRHTTSGSFAALFCSACGEKWSHSIDGLGPIVLNVVDQVNLGIPLEEKK